jgi:hypothetical protein
VFKRLYFSIIKFPKKLFAINLSKYIINKKQIVFYSLVALAIVHVLFVFLSFYNNDDINYARYAANFSNYGIDTTPATSHFQLRWAIIFVTTIFYKLFGIGVFSSSLCSLLSLLFCGYLLQKEVKNYNETAYTFSLLFYFFAHSILFFMHRLLPDSLVCLLVFWMYVVYKNYLQHQKKVFSNALFFAVLSFVAMLAKETVIIAFPLFVIFCCSDIFKKQNIKFWIYVFLSVLVMLFFYCLYFKITTGNSFYRYSLLQSNSYVSECSFDKLPFIYTLQRIGYLLFKAMLLQGDLLLLFPAIVGCFYYKKIEVDRITVFAFIVLLLLCNFMTISFTSYMPLCHDPRHFLFLFPFAAIISGKFLYQYFLQPPKFILLPIVYCVATFILFYLQAGTTKYLYLMFSIIFLSSYLLACLQVVFLNIFFGFALMGVLSLNYFGEYFITYGKDFYPQKKVIEQVFFNYTSKAKVFVSDSKSAEYCDFFLSFTNKNIVFNPTDSILPNETGNLFYLHIKNENDPAKNKIESIKKTQNATIYFELANKCQQVELYKVNNAALKALID